MITAKTKMSRMPKTCKQCTLSYEDYCGERVCAITKRECPWEVSPSGNARYGKPSWCPLREVNDSDQQAQEECTRQGIVLSCPLCGSIYTQVRHMGWENPPQAFQAGYRGECTECHAVTGAHNTEKEALADWNRRPAPPIGRCGECAHWYKQHCAHGPCATEPTDADFFCGSFEPKGGRENG